MTDLTARSLFRCPTVSVQIVTSGCSQESHTAVLHLLLTRVKPASVGSNREGTGSAGFFVFTFFGSRSGPVLKYPAK